MSTRRARDKCSQLARHVLLGAALVGIAATGAEAEEAEAAVPRDAGEVEAAPTDPTVGQVRALLTGSLDPEISPQSLFEIPLDNDTAIEIEALRLRAVLRAAEPPPPKPRRGKSDPITHPDAGSLRAAIEAIGPARWDARLDLDRVRLEFYSLSGEKRGDLLLRRWLGDP